MIFRILGFLISSWIVAGVVLRVVYVKSVRPRLRARRIAQLEAENQRLDQLIEDDIYSRRSQ